MSLEDCDEISAIVTLSELQKVWAYIFWRSLRIGDLPPLNYTRGGMKINDDELSYFRLPRRERFRERFLSGPTTGRFALESDFQGLREVRRATVEHENSEIIYRDALNYFQDASSADPYNPVYVYHIALCFQRLGEFENSRRAYRRLFDLESHPDIYWLDTYHRLNDAMGLQDERIQFQKYPKPECTCENKYANKNSPPKIVFAGIVRDASEHLKRVMIPLLERTYSFFINTPR